MQQINRYIYWNLSYVFLFLYNIQKTRVLTITSVWEYTSGMRNLRPGDQMCLWALYTPLANTLHRPCSVPSWRAFACLDCVLELSSCCLLVWMEAGVGGYKLLTLVRVVSCCTEVRHPFLRPPMSMLLLEGGQWANAALVWPHLRFVCRREVKNYTGIYSNIFAFHSAVSRILFFGGEKVWMTVFQKQSYILRCSSTFLY